jgi:hypothetical protein
LIFFLEMQTFHQNLFVYSVFLKNLIDFDETSNLWQIDRLRLEERDWRERERETPTDNIALIALKFAQQQVSKQTEILSKKILFFNKITRQAVSKLIWTIKRKINIKETSGVNLFPLFVYFVSQLTELVCSSFLTFPKKIIIWNSIFLNKIIYKIEIDCFVYQFK